MKERDSDALDMLMTWERPEKKKVSPFMLSLSDLYKLTSRAIVKDAKRLLQSSLEEAAD